MPRFDAEGFEIPPRETGTVEGFEIPVARAGGAPQGAVATPPRPRGHVLFHDVGAHRRNRHAVVEDAEVVLDEHPTIQARGCFAVDLRASHHSLDRRRALRTPVHGGTPLTLFLRVPAVLVALLDARRDALNAGLLPDAARWTRGMVMGVAMVDLAERWARELAAEGAPMVPLVVPRRSRRKAPHGT